MITVKGGNYIGVAISISKNNSEIFELWLMRTKILHELHCPRSKYAPRPEATLGNKTTKATFLWYWWYNFSHDRRALTDRVQYKFVTRLPSDNDVQNLAINS